MNYLALRLEPSGSHALAERSVVSGAGSIGPAIVGTAPHAGLFHHKVVAVRQRDCESHAHLPLVLGEPLRHVGVRRVGVGLERLLRDGLDQPVHVLAHRAVRLMKMAGMKM